jgi:hypothetical protein
MHRLLRVHRISSKYALGQLFVHVEFTHTHVVSVVHGALVV